jgi:hypothetical protein
MTDTKEIIENQKKSILETLERSFPNVSLADTPALADELEVLLISYAHDVLTKNSNLLLGLNCAEHECFMTLEENSTLFSVKINEDAKTHSVLNIVIQPHSITTEFQIKEFHIGIKSYGKVNDIVLYYPNCLSPNLLLINSLLKCNFEMAYNWFELKIDELAANEKVALAVQIYDYTKKIIFDKKLRNQLWFATITKGFGFRLIERNVSIAMFPEMDKYSGFFGLSTNKLVAEMLSTKLPREQLLMHKVIQEKKVMDVNISDSKYAADGNIYAAAMSAFYGSDSFTIHPVLLQEAVNVLALYPTDYREQLEEILDNHKEALRKICKRATSNIQKAINIFDKRKLGISKYGELAGGFTRGLLDLQ